MNNPKTCFVCALPAEAKALCENYRLSKLKDKAWPVYENEEIVLIVSGMGQNAVVNAVGYLAGHLDGNVAHFLNVGIAGHASLERGAGVWVGKITHQHEAVACYPAPVIRGKPTIKPLITGDRPVEIYSQDSLHDMEGYGFFKAATHYVPVDLIQLYKVVSDNTLQGIEAIDKASVYEWIKAKLAEIDHMRKQQFALAMELVQARDLFELEKLFEACHFTHYESVRLKQLLQRAKALRLSADAVEKVIGEGKNKKDILNGLDEILLQAGLGFRP